MIDETSVGDRYLLCRPRNGLNDALVHIETCWRYAEKFNRILVIDPIRCAIFTNLSLFFSPLSPSPRIQFHIFPNQIECLNNLTCQPSEINGRLTTYVGKPFQLGVSYVLCDSESEVPLRVDMTRDYPEAVILYESIDGGTESIDFLKRVKLELGLARDAIAQIRQLGPNYAAVHVRHTDYKTDWRKFLKSIRGELRGRTVLICSDSAKVIHAAPSLLKNSVVRTVSQLRYTDGKPQHIRNSTSDEARNATARSALVDLLSLGAASDLYITRHARGNTSGYSQLAASICADRTVLNSLLGENLYNQNNASGKVHHVRFSESFMFILKIRVPDIYKRLVSSFKRFAKRCLHVLGLLT